MNREILFKAKRKDDGKWVEGYYEKRFDVDGNEQHFIFWSKSYTVWEYAEIDPSTLCQFTGLTDKNGKKIWENDIVDGHQKRGDAFYHCRVLWNKRKARFDILAVYYNFPMILDGCSNDISMRGLDYEVCGNIFDNPELLKE